MVNLLTCPASVLLVVILVMTVFLLSRGPRSAWTNTASSSCKTTWLSRTAAVALCTLEPYCVNMLIACELSTIRTCATTCSSTFCGILCSEAGGLICPGEAIMVDLSLRRCQCSVAEIRGGKKRSLDSHRLLKRTRTSILVKPPQHGIGTSTR